MKKNNKLSKSEYRVNIGFALCLLTAMLVVMYMHLFNTVGFKWGLIIGLIISASIFIVSAIYEVLKQFVED